MRNEINLVKFNNNVPLSFSVINFDSIFTHMHQAVQLIIVLNGQIEVTIEDNIYLAQENDIFIINPKEKHKMKAASSATVLSTLIDQNGFGLEDELTNDVNFNLNSMTNPNNPRYESIRYIVYSIIVYNTKNNINSIYTNKAIAYSLFAQLMNDFRMDISESIKRKEANSTINQITGYINDHYKENISLNFLSEHFNYSNAYLSRLFKASLNSNFKDYYDELRVNYSLNDLLFTNINIEEIAIRNGFDNSRSYVRAFLNIFKVYPSEYRKNHKENTLSLDVDENVLRKESLDKIIDYYNDYNNRNQKNENTRDTEELINVDINQDAIKAVNPINKVLAFGDITYLQVHDIKKDLVNIKNDIGFKHLMLTNLVSNYNTSLFKKDIDFTYYVNSIAFDNTISFLESINMKPYFKFNFSYFKMSLTDLDNIMNMFISYVNENYSNNTISDWMITIDINDNLSTLSEDELNAFYNDVLSIYTNIKKTFNTKVMLGAPTFYKEDIYNNKGLVDFIKLAKYRRVPIDFYPINYFKEAKENIILKDKDSLKSFIKFLKEKELFFENKMYFENVSFTNKKNLLFDTLYDSSYIVKNVMDNFKSLGSYSQNCFCDYLLIDYSSKKDLYSGLPGLLTYNSIKKASYNAFVLLSKMNDSLLKKSRNYMISKTDDTIKILINNYNHYADLFAENEYYELTKTNRYNCFAKSTNIIFKFSFDNLAYKNIKIKKYYINKESGSSFDIYNELVDENTILSMDEVESLKNICNLKFSISSEQIANKKYELTTSLSPLETQLIEIKFSK